MATKLVKNCVCVSLNSVLDSIRKNICNHGSCWTNPDEISDDEWYEGCDGCDVGDSVREINNLKTRVVPLD